MPDDFLWLAIRSLGVTAYLALSFEVLFGLSLSTGYLGPWARRTQVLAVHRVLSLIALTTVGLHAGLLLWDRFVPFTVGELLVPFSSRFRPFAIGLGVIGLYLVLLLELSQWARVWIGAKWWRSLHASAFALYVLATFHGALAGSDTTRLGLQIMYLGSAGLVAFLVFLRLFQRVVRSRTLPAA